MTGPIARALSGEYGLFDRIVELGVLGLIAYEVAVGVVRHRRAVKRQKELGSIVRSLTDFMFKGQTLQQGVPDPTLAQWQAQDSWVREVADWVVDTSQFLSDRSQQAASSFLLVLDSSSSDSQLTMLAGNTVKLYGPVRQRYQMLLVHLSNLRSIMEKPEAYF
jgi:hypothetical protein